MWTREQLPSGWSDDSAFSQCQNHILLCHHNVALWPLEIKHLAVQVCICVKKLCTRRSTDITSTWVRQTNKNKRRGNESWICVKWDRGGTMTSDRDSWWDWVDETVTKLDKETALRQREKDEDESWKKTKARPHAAASHPVMCSLCEWAALQSTVLFTEAPSCSWCGGSCLVWWSHRSTHLCRLDVRGTHSEPKLMSNMSPAFLSQMVHIHCWDVYTV